MTRRLGTSGPGLRGWDHTGRLFPMYGAAVGTLYLVRPDRYVLARWGHVVPAEVTAAVSQALA